MQQGVRLMGDRGQEDGQASMLVAVDERDLRFVPGAQVSFSAYWRDAHDRAVRALDTGEQVLLAPLVDFAYVRSCEEASLNPLSEKGFRDYARRRFRKNELWPFAGETADEMLLQMKREQHAWAMAVRCRKVFEAVNAQHPGAEAWAKTYSAGVVTMLVEEVGRGAAVACGGERSLLALATKAGDLELGRYAVPVGAVGRQTDVLDRDRERFIALLGASLIAASSGVLTLTMGDGGPVQVWTVGRQGLIPSEHGELILEPNDANGRSATYVPGFALPAPV
ncbi:hypothetical protein ACF1A9_27805 [Streptomyces sp. NPDC014872]|uniref:hypothetical protein n=1 Tax=Streptomyces sp. NPDC014872 TaxID=3364926 RepID=UPI003701FA2F